MSNVLFYQYEAGQVQIDFEGVPSSAIENAVVTLKQGKVTQEYYLSDLNINEEGTITVYVTQTESGQFIGGKPVYIQANFLLTDGTRKVSKIIEAKVGENLHRKVMS